MVVCSIQANTNHLANSLDQRQHVFTTTFVHSRGSTSDWCMRECSHLNWASQSHVDKAGASFLHAQQPPHHHHPPPPPPKFLHFCFIFHPFSMLAVAIHPHPCIISKGSERRATSSGKSSAESNLITLVLTCSQWLVHWISCMSVSWW